MSFLSILETIGKDVEIGIAAAAPIVGTFVPQVGPILAQAGSIIGDLESAGHPAPTPAAASALVQAVAHVQTVEQHATAA